MIASQVAYCVLFLIFILKNSLYVYATCSEEGITEWKNYDFPNPQVDINKCGRCVKSWVCDPNNILTDLQANALDKKIKKIRDSAKCVCSYCNTDERGYAIAIAIVDKMKDPGYLDIDIEATARSFAKLLLAKWDFEKCENDVVIFLSNKDRKIFTEVGRKTSEILGYKCLERMYEVAKSQLSIGNYASVLEFMIEQYRLTLEQGSCSSNIVVNSNTESSVIGIIFGVLGSIVAFIVILTCCCVCWRCGGNNVSRGRSRGGGSDYGWGPGGGWGGGGGVGGGGDGGGGDGGGGDGGGGF